MLRLLPVVLVALLCVGGAVTGSAQREDADQSVERWRAFAATVKIGDRLNVRLFDDTTVKGNLAEVTAKGLTMTVEAPNDRFVLRTLAFSQIEDMSRSRSFRKAFIIAGVAGVAFWVLIGWALLIPEG